MASFVLGQSTLGTSATLGTRFKTFKVKIYDTTTSTWKTYKPVIINNLTVPTNAVVDKNNTPILTSNGDFILVDENTTGLTAETIYADCVSYKAYIFKDPSQIYSSDGNIIYSDNNQPVYIR